MSMTDLMSVEEALTLIDNKLDELQTVGLLTQKQNNAVYYALYHAFLPEEEIDETVMAGYTSEREEQQS